MTQPSQNFTPVPPDLNAWIRLVLQGFAASFNCVSLATVNSFDPIHQTVNLTINYFRVFKNANPNLPNNAPDGQTSDVLLPYPILIQCPVFILQGGSAYLTMPIQATVYNADGTVKIPGDTGIVLFNDREITTWFKTGQVLPPQNQRTHDLADGIYFGGIRNLLNVIANYNTQVASLTDSTGERLLQSGMMMGFGGAAAPTGWLLCDGTSYDKNTYPLLFAAIGTTYGGSGNNFNVPDMRGRVAAGIGGTLGLTLGQQFGETTHTLVIAEMPSHVHNIGGNISYQGGGSTDGRSTGGGVGESGTTGGDGAHNNVQPTLGINWIIKI